MMINFFKKENNLLNSKATQAGFAMLFTVLLVSLILTIALSISSITLKQTILSSLAKDSQVAFYQADAGVECGLYQETIGTFPQGSNPGSVANKFLCGENYMLIDSIASMDDYFIFYEDNSNPNGPCFSILFDKRDDGLFIVQSRGYNRCTSSPRQVERGLEVIY